MKKVLLIAGIIAIFVAAAILYRWLAAPEFTLDTKKFGLPSYTGQELNYLGDAAVLSRYPEELVVQHKERLRNALEFLQNNDPASVDHWLEVGMVKKTFDNYVGARDAWEYAKLVNPEHPLPYANLGRLYGFYLQDLQKAEQNYLDALNFDPNADYLYLGLAELYRDAYAAKYNVTKDILLKGLENLPGNPDMITGLALFYKNAGDHKKAIYYFQQLLKNRNISEQQKQSIQDEIKSLLK